MSFLVVYRKRTIDNKFNLDLKFNIIIYSNFPKSAPEIYCICNFSTPTLYDNRNLLYSVIGKEWSEEITIDNLISLIPNFADRVAENNSHKYMIYYGEYLLDYVYDINLFLMNNDINFFKCFQFMKQKNSSGTFVRKERYIILTDIYFLLFEPAPNYRNMAKLIFWGDIRQIMINKTDNYHENEKAHSYILEWKNENVQIINFEILFLNFFVNTNLTINPIQDFIDSLNKRSSKLKDNFKVFHEDYFKPINVIVKSSNFIENIHSIIKYNESKFLLYKNSYLANSLILLYEKLNEYYSKSNYSNEENNNLKIKNLKMNKDYDNKTVDNYDIKFNIKDNFALSRSYSNTYHDEYI